MSAEFTVAAKSKGWQMQEVAERWGITPRQISRIAAAPKQIHWDALDGLPDKD
jgi:hypothetical protein